MTRVLALGAALLAGATACSEDPYVIDPFPVSASFAAGPPQLLGCAPGVRACDQGPLVVVLDTGTPVTVIEADVGTDARRRARSAFELLSVQGVTRARFDPVAALVGPVGAIGTADAPLEVDAIVGGDLLSTLAVRLDPGAGRIFFFPNIAGAADVLARACSSVFPVGRVGGGSFVLNGAEVSYPATRLVVGACLNLDPNPTRDTPPDQRRPKRRGADALLVVATGLPITVLGEDAYARACAAIPAGGPPCPELAALPRTQLALPGSAPGVTVDAALGELEWIGLSADELEERGACDEITTSRMLDLGGCEVEETRSDGFVAPCPCDNGRCELAGATAEAAGPITVAVVPDDSPVLQALREELRPELAEVDGFLGMNAISKFVTDFDYPGGRIVFRCEEDRTDTCVVRPRLTLEARDELVQCLGRQFFRPTQNPVN